MTLASVTRIVASLSFMLTGTVGLGAADAEQPGYGRLRLGPVYLSGRISASAGVDDNIYNTEVGTVADETLTLTPRITGVLPLTRRLRLKATGALAPHFYGTERSQRHTDRFGEFGGEADVGPFSFGAFRGAGRYRQRFSLEIDERLRREQSGTRISAALRLRRVTLMASRTNVTSTFDSGSTDQRVDLALDRRSTTWTTGLKLALTRKTALVPSVDLVEDEFLHSSGMSPLVRSERFMAALEFSRLAFISGRVAAGLRRIEAGQGVAPYVGPYLAIEAGMPFILGTRVQLDASRDVGYTVAAAIDPTRRNTALNSAYGLELLFALPWQLHGRLLGGQNTLTYLSTTSADAELGQPEHRLWTYGTALLRRFGDNVSLGGLIQRSERATAFAGRDPYLNTTYGLTAEVQF